MNVHEHSLISQRKFGGEPGDYSNVHSFMDTSKYFVYHVRHRMLLHNLYGVELAVQLFGQTLTNSSGKVIPVRDVAVAHCREDLGGKMPTLYDWLKENTHLEEHVKHVPEFDDKELDSFVWKPYLRSGLRASLIITCSDLGVHLAEALLGLDKARKLAGALPPGLKVQSMLETFKFTHRWQYTPQREELEWLRKHAQQATGREQDLKEHLNTK